MQFTLAIITFLATFTIVNAQDEQLPLLNVNGAIGKNLTKLMKDLSLDAEPISHYPTISLDEILRNK